MDLKVYKTPLNLQIVDFDMVAKMINAAYHTYVVKNNLWFEESFNEKEQSRLLMYFTYYAINNVQTYLGSKKDVIFFINESNTQQPSIINKLKTVADYIPVVYYESSESFDIFSKSTGHTRELLECITSTRYHYNFEEYTPRKEKSFFKKYKINKA